MKNLKTLILLVMIITGAFLSSFSPEQKKTIVAFVDVTVIPMDTERILEHQTVIVEEDRILLIGNRDKIKVPRRAVVVDGKGKYLIPGLADMHAHLAGKEGQPFEMKEYLRLNVLRGVTTIRSMRGAPGHPSLRDSVRKGLLLSPALYLGSPGIIGDEKFTADKAKTLIREYKAQGFDFIKYLAGCSAPLFDSLAMIAKVEGMRIAGHAPASGLAGAIINSEASVEHIAPFVNAWREDSVKFKQQLAEMVQKNMFHCPNVYWYQLLCDRLSPEQLSKSEGLPYLSPGLRKHWEEQFIADRAEMKKEGDAKFQAWSKRVNMSYDIYMHLLKQIDAADVKLLISPSDGEYIIPGFSMVEEMKLFVQAGVSPYRTLKAATINAAAFFGEEQLWGSIGKGKRADLVLLADNPLANISNVAKIEGVMLRGKWISKEEIDLELNRMKR